MNYDLSGFVFPQGNIFHKWLFHYVIIQGEGLVCTHMITSMFHSGIEAHCTQTVCFLGLPISA